MPDTMPLSDSQNAPRDNRPANDDLTRVSQPISSDERFRRLTELANTDPYAFGCEVGRRLLFGNLTR